MPDTGWPWQARGLPVLDLHVSRALAPPHGGRAGQQDNVPAVAAENDCGPDFVALDVLERDVHPHHRAGVEAVAGNDAQAGDYGEAEVGRLRDHPPAAGPRSAHALGALLLPNLLVHWHHPLLSGEYLR